ncbi:DUF3999 domain-containing protein [Lysobacter tyrosinilyticus]
MKRLVFLGLLLPVMAIAAPRDEYAQQWPLTLGRDNAGAYRVTLDERVYRQLRDPSIRDVVVINHDGAAVPTDVFAPEAPLAKSAPRIALPWFPLPSTPPGNAAQGWELVSQADADGRLRRVEVRTTDAGAAALPRTALLVDVSRVREAIAALELEWLPVESLDLGYRVEASDDLDHWQLLATRGRMVDLTREDRRLLHRRIELYGLLPQYQKVRYLRLTPDRSDQLISVTGVFADLASAGAAAVPNWVEPRGRSVDVRGSPAGTVFDFDSGGRFPVRRVDVVLPGNSAVEWRLESRDSDEADWRLRAGPWVAFQVGPDGAATRSPEQNLGAMVRDRHWRLRASTPVAGVPVLRLGYYAEVVVFVTQGAAPYALAGGSTRSRRPDSPLPQLVAEMRRQRGAQWQPTPAYLGTPQVLAGERALSAVRDWKSWLLWGVLSLGALVVAGFAIGLLRGKPEPAPDSADSAGEVSSDPPGS